MKKVGFSSLVLSGFICVANADQFQFKTDFAGGLSDSSYATVTVATNKLGRTDKLGRITVNLPDGVYDAKVIENNKEYKTTLTINGSKSVKTIVAKPQ